MKNIAWVCWWIVVLAGCEQSHELGSDCPDGVCPRAAGRAEPACLVRQSSTLVQVDYGEPYPPLDPPPDLWLFSSDTIDFGTRRVYWRFDERTVLPNGEMLRACDDLPYLEAPDVDDEGATQLQREASEARVCVVKPATRTAGGDFAEDGWYYGEETASGMRTLSYTPGIEYLPNHVTIWVTRTGAESIARNGQLKETDPGICSLPEDSSTHEEDVGRSCSLSASVEGGYGDQETVIETGSTQCATGACVVYKLFGDPKKPCGNKPSDSSCQSPDDKNSIGASKDEIAKRMYCSCRCDAPEGDPGELCSCKSGYSCVPTLFHAPEGVRGSYCLKNGTFSESGL